MDAPRATLAAQVSDLPGNYTRPGAPIAKGLAPGIQAKLLDGGPGGSRSYALIFSKGDEVMSGLTDWAQQEKIVGGHLTAIGAFSSALFGWFDESHRAYRHIPIDRQAECISLIGNVGLVDSKPALHVHGAVALSDGAVHGGHLLHATVWPTLEVFVSTTESTLDKEHDPETDLWFFDLRR